MGRGYSAPGEEPPVNEVVTLGETMILLRPATPGPLRHAPQFFRTFGGAETNVAIGLARLGHRVGWISRVGDDEFGRYIMAAVRGEGVDTTHLTLDPDAPTGLMFKETRPGRESRVYYYRKGSAASRLGPEDLPSPYFRGARFVHLTGITPALSPTCRSAVLQALDLARQAGAAVSFDPNLRRKLWSETEARTVLLEIAARSDLFLPGIEEAEFLFGSGTEEELAARALRHGARAVVLKLGPRGCLVADQSGMVQVPGFAVTVVDPVGAGDAFAAGLISGLLRGRALPEAARLGNACGALACTSYSDWEGFPEPEELDLFLAGRPERTR